MKINWKIVWESVKEPLREIVMAIIPFVLAYLEKIPAEWAAILYLVIRAIDKYLHESKTMVKGLTGF